MNNNFIYLFYIIVIALFLFLLYNLKIYNYNFIESYKNNKKDNTYWGLDYRGSLQNDNYWVPQLNLHPTHIFYDPDYEET